MEMGNYAKTIRLTWHNILSILQKGSIEKYWNWAIIGILKCTAGRKLIVVGDI